MTPNLTILLTFLWIALLLFCTLLLLFFFGLVFWHIHDTRVKNAQKQTDPPPKKPSS